MKKVGKLTEARMVLPPEPKVYPMVSDRLFEGKVKRKKKLKEVEVPDPRDLASNRPPQPSLSTTNSPARATSKSVQVGGPYDEEANEAKKEKEMKESSQGEQRLKRVAAAIEKRRNQARDKSWSPDQATRDKAFKDMDKLRTKSNRVAFKQGYQDSARASRAANTGGDPRNNNSENS